MSLLNPLDPKDIQSLAAAISDHIVLHIAESMPDTLRRLFDTTGEYELTISLRKKS